MTTKELGQENRLVEIESVVGLPGAGVPQMAARPSLLDRSLFTVMQLNWEIVAWVVLIIVAAALRFIDVGVRAMSHDESLHALYSYYLYDNGKYEHNPMMHGPLLFHMDAIAYFLFGDNDTTARLPPVLFGIAVVWMMWLYRRYIGRLGALAAAVMITISPSLLFHSRYIRNDIYIALFVLIWIYGAFRYLETKQPRYLLMVAMGMAWGFIAKENHFMNGAIIGAFFVGLAIWQWMGKKVWRASADLAVLMVTLVLPFSAPFILLFPFRWDLKAKFDNINGWTTGEMTLAAVLVVVLLLISVSIAYLWFALWSTAGTKAKAESSGPKDEHATGAVVGFFGWLKIMGAFWLIQVLFFTTFLTNIRNGLATGVVGSLGYWLAQQEVARGGQPWYYYFMLGALYEFLPWILSGIGMITIGYWLIRRRNWDPVASRDLPANAQAEVMVGGKINEGAAEAQRQVRVDFAVFGIWWVLATWLAYTVAGEKMPWLMTHMALTMCVVGGWWFGRLIGRVDWGHIWERRAFWLVGVTPALLLSLLALFGATPSIDRSLSAMAGNMQRILAILVIGALLYAIWRWGESVGWKSAARLLGIGFVALLLLLTVRFSYMLNYINYDMATEYLVYAHASPDVKRALNEIDSISERTVGGRNIVVSYDNESSWPLSWYMRLYPNHKFYGAAPNSDTMSAPIVIVGPENYDKVHPYVMRDYVKRSYRLVWWPDMDYFNLTWDRFFGAFTDPQQRERIFQIAFYRRYRDAGNTTTFRDLAQWPHRHEFEMWVRRDLASQIWDLGVAPTVQLGNSVDDVALDKEIEVSALASYSGDYGGLSLLNPREIAVGADGTRAIADSGNHRIVILNGNGDFVRAVGSRCNLAEGEAGGCVDPDGSGPLTLGDGQFNEPWGIALDATGRLYVADTWNGRIQVFDSEGKFLQKWGTFNTTNGELGDAYALFGPRGIAIDLEGNLLVADTGNKRILKFTPNGELVQQVGGGGVVGGRFEEPVGVGVSAVDGSVYVADTWNQRIQKLSPALEFIAEWPAAGWDSQEIFDKPYLDVAPNGDVYVTDPQFYRVVVYASTGEIKAAFGTFGNGVTNFDLPTGIAIDPTTGIVLVTDANNNRVQSFPPVP